MKRFLVIWLSSVAAFCATVVMLYVDGFFGKSVESPGFYVIMGLAVFLVSVALAFYFYKNFNHNHHKM